MAAVETFARDIEDMVKNNMSYADISSTLINNFGPNRGYSERSIRRFCTQHGLIKRPLTRDQLETEVAQGVGEAGPTYGRKMLKGYLASKGVMAGEKRVGSVLREINPRHHQARCDGARNLNPTPYTAEYMGHKIHMDQNEKLVMYGATHVLAIDGFSSKIVGHSTMPVKNNLTIYEHVYRAAVTKHGLWDQVRVDRGKEFFLTLFMQETLQAYRHNQERRPYLQTKSTENHTIERLWPEINDRVNYPLKAAMVQLMDQDVLSMDDNTVKYCSSQLLCQVSHIGVTRVVAAWNAHSIPGKGVPNLLAGSGCKVKIPDDLLPPASEAASMYERELGSSLTRTSIFGQDPFPTAEAKLMAEREFCTVFPDMTVLYESAVHHNYKPYQDALRCLIDVTNRHI